jgi:hypothetical protein
VAPGESAGGDAVTASDFIKALEAGACGHPVFETVDGFPFCNICGARILQEAGSTANAASESKGDDDASLGLKEKREGDL